MKIHFIDISLEKNEKGKYELREKVSNYEVVTNDSFYISYKHSDEDDEDLGMLEHRDLDFISTDFINHVGYYMQYITLDETIIEDKKKEMVKEMRESIKKKISPLELMLSSIPEEK